MPQGLTEDRALAHCMQLWRVILSFPKSYFSKEAVMAGLLQNGLRDVRFALRQLRKNPGYSITATAMLAVAICANSTVFSWIEGTMLRPIPMARNAGE